MSPLVRYAGLFRPHMGRLLAAVVLLLLSSAIPALVVLLLQQTLEALEHKVPMQSLAQLCGAYVGLAVVRGALLLLRTRWTKGVAWQVAADLRRQLHAHLLQTPARFQAELGSKLASLSTEVDEVQYGVSAFVTLVRSPLTLLGLGVSAFLVAPQLAMWPLMLALPIGGVAWVGGQLLRRRASAQRAARSEVLRLAADQFRGLDVIQERQVAPAESARFQQVNQRDEQARLALEVDRLIPSAMVQITAAAGVAGLRLCAGTEMRDDTLAPADLVSFAVALGLMSRPLSALSEVWAQGQRALAALAVVHQILETALPDEPPDPTPAPTGPVGLAIRQVTAAWDDHVVLKDLDFAVAADEMVALVGASGAGKSTLLSLVTRQIEPSAGTVTVGGLDVRHLRRADLARLVARVSQRAVVFSRSIRENLQLSCPDATDEQLWVALEQADAGFVGELPDGLDTQVAEDGRRLSGGQRQRLCLARALLTNAPILLLDEATNQVDAVSEEAMIQALRRLVPGRTIVLVAHDLNTAQRADRIVVVGGGKVLEEGDHATLMERGG